MENINTNTNNHIDSGYILSHSHFRLAMVWFVVLSFAYVVRRCVRDGRKSHDGLEVVECCLERVDAVKLCLMSCWQKIKK